jgi:hypothetical protein
VKWISYFYFLNLCISCIPGSIIDRGDEPPTELLRIPGVFKQLQVTREQNSELVSTTAAEALTRASAYQARASDNRLHKRGPLNENLKKAVASKSLAKDFLAERAAKRDAHNDKAMVRVDVLLYKLCGDSEKMVQVSVC